MAELAKCTSSFEALTWADLWETLEGLAGEGPIGQAGLRFAEVTDLVQGQLFSQHPIVALRMSRVVELRFTAVGAVAYLRTGIPVGQESATPEAGAFLIGLRRYEPETGTYGFLRYPRVKRMPTWRQNLKRRLREILDDLEAGAAADPTREAQSLAELMTAEKDDLEADLTWQGPSAESQVPWSPAEAGGLPAAQGNRWGDLEAAGISLPVWLSVITSLALVLAVLGGR